VLLLIIGYVQPCQRLNRYRNPSHRHVILHTLTATYPYPAPDNAGTVRNTLVHVMSFHIISMK